MRDREEDGDGKGDGDGRRDRNGERGRRRELREMEIIECTCVYNIEGTICPVNN